MSNGKTFFQSIQSYAMAQGDNKIAMEISCKWNGKSGVPPRVPFAFKPVKTGNFG